MASQESLLATLRQTLPFSDRLSFEWSFEILKDGLRERDKLICWIHHDRGRANEEIALCRQLLLADFPVLREVPADAIVSLGIGIGPGRWLLYLHHVRPDGSDSCQGFDGERVLEYQFHYFPCTPAMETPEQFVCPELATLFQTMSSDPCLQALSGFWLRKNRQAVDQVSLSYIHRPALKELVPALQTWTRADLRAVEHWHIKHLAFNARASLSVYASARTRSFPASMDDLLRQVEAGAAASSRQIGQRLQGLSFLPRARDRLLDDFYSPADFEGWRRLLGHDMFYHFGLFEAGDDPRDIWSDRPFERAAEDLCRHISPGERVYDLGCGYGGVSKYLRERRNCSVLGATISRVQFQHCHRIGIPCRYTDMEASLPPGLFDTILMCESLEHVGNKFALLKKLKRFTRKLVIRTNTQEVPGQNIVFGGTMNVVSSACLAGMLEECGYEIVHFEDRRAQSLPTIDVWKARLEAVSVDDDPHYAAWKEFVQRVSGRLQAWSEQHMLLDIVAICR